LGNKFTAFAEKALNATEEIAENLGHTYIGSEHILMSLLKLDNCCAKSILKKYGCTSLSYEKALRDYLGCYEPTVLTPQNMTPRCKKILESSLKIAQRNVSVKIGTEHILCALLEEKECMGIKILQYMAIDVVRLREEVIMLLKTGEKFKENTVAKNVLPLSLTILKYGKNLTSLAYENKLEPMIGRENELNRLICILSRKMKNNPCLIGEAGVGKTAIAEGLAQQIAKGHVPPSLFNKQIISLDLTSVIAGTKYRGDFEERLKSILDEVKKYPNIVLFIDEIHSIVGAGAAEGAIDASNIMKPELARGEIQLIGATTFDEYRKTIEKDAALSRRFQPVFVEEPNDNQTLSILKGIKTRYETYHGVHIDDAVLNSVIEFSNAYMDGRRMPDKAIDLLDESCASVALRQSMRIQSDKLENDNEDNQLLSRSLENRLTESDVKNAVLMITGGMGSSTSFDVSTLLNRLKSEIFGQDDAVDTIVNAILRNKTGISDKNRPIGVFLFVGESGVGKTELSKSLARHVFRENSSFIRYDMSDFSQEQAVSKLIGTSPGYVGYDDGNTLTEKVFRHPYSVILLDEIEKACPEVLNLLLQIFDEGYLTDSTGKKVSFLHTLILMTSSRVGKGKNTIFGFGQENDCIEKDEQSSLSFFSNEWIGRVDEIIRFAPLSDTSLFKILKKKGNEVVLRTKKIGITCQIDDSVYLFLLRRYKKKGQGARPLLHALYQKALTPLSMDIAQEKYGHGDTVTIYEKNNEICIALVNSELKKGTKKDCLPTA